MKANTAKHTPGWWRVVEHKFGESSIIKVESRNEVICDAIGNIGNANLIASAPGLLGALEDFVDTIEATGGLDSTGAPKGDPEWVDLGIAYASAKRILAKAKGEL